MEIVKLHSVLLLSVCSSLSVCLLVDFLVVNLLLCDYGSVDFSNLYICCERTGNNKTLETVADGIDKSQACDMNVEANSTDTTDGRHDDKPRPYWCNVLSQTFCTETIFEYS